MSAKTLSITFFMVLLFSCQEKQMPQSLAPVPKPVEIVTPLIKDIPIVREFIGQVSGKVDIPIRARVDGYLTKIHFSEGRPVKKGALLYSIDDYPFQAEVAGKKSELSEAKIMAVNAKAEFERVKPLVEINAISKSEYDAAYANMIASQENVKSAEASLKLAEIELGYCTISSPISGVIGKTQADVGDYVGKSPNPVILNTVSQIDTIQVEFFITENEYLGLMREIIEARKDSSNEMAKGDESSLELVLSDGTLFNHKGTYNFIDRGVDASTGTILIQTSFPNPEGFIRPGQFAKVRTTSKSAKNAVLIPRKCLIEIQGNEFLYVVSNENKISQISINVLGTYQDYVVVSGLSPEAKVVLNGIQKIREGDIANPTEVEYTSKAN